MSKTTKNLGLFEYEKDKDGASTFNIEQALNGNWDKLERSCSACKDHGIGFRGQEDRERRQSDCL